jgi:hypothetical protein
LCPDITTRTIHQNVDPSEGVPDLLRYGPHDILFRKVAMNREHFHLMLAGDRPGHGFE